MRCKKGIIKGEERKGFGVKTQKGEREDAGVGVR